MVLVIRRALFALFCVAVVMIFVALPKGHACTEICPPGESYVASITWLSVGVAALVVARVLRREEPNDGRA
jgi:hypothetical protein